MSKYVPEVSAHEASKDGQKPQPRERKTGRLRKSAREGMTSQKTWPDKAAIGPVFPVSRYIQMNASRVVTGKAASNAASALCRLAISEMATISSAETKILTM